MSDVRSLRGVLRSGRVRSRKARAGSQAGMGLSLACDRSWEGTELDRLSRLTCLMTSISKWTHSAQKRRGATLALFRNVVPVATTPVVVTQYSCILLSNTRVGYGVVIGLIAQHPLTLNLSLCRLRGWWRSERQLPSQPPCTQPSGTTSRSDTVAAPSRRRQLEAARHPWSACAPASACAVPMAP